MEPRTASELTDALACTGHPRLDYTTEEGRRYAMRLAPYLEPLVRPGIRALDLGCSFGKSTFLLCELGACVTGIDVSVEALAFASNLGRKLHADAVFALADYARLPFCSGSFELALFPHNVVECSPPEFALVASETSRVLVAAGVFAVSVATKWADGNQSRPTLRDTTVTVTGQGTFAYPTYSWSVEAVQKVVVPHFALKSSLEMPERDGTWMVFSNRKLA